MFFHIMVYGCVPCIFSKLISLIIVPLLGGHDG